MQQTLAGPEKCSRTVRRVHLLAEMDRMVPVAIVADRYALPYPGTYWLQIRTMTDSSGSAARSDVRHACPARSRTATRL